MSVSNVAGIILAAGKGTRMKSDLPKGLHRCAGVPMVELVARAMRAAGVERPVIVIGHGGEHIRAELGDAYDYVWQHEQLGTGHAALMAKDVLSGFVGDVFVAAGDTPLLEGDTFASLLSAHREAGSVVTVSTAILDDPHGYGRIVRNEKGTVVRSVEQKDADQSEREIREVNSGLYCVDCSTLFRILPTLSSDNAQGEYYLPDVLNKASEEGLAVAGFVMEDPGILVGVNDRWQLALADKDLRRRTLKKHAMNGVTFLDLDSVWIGVDVQIASDAVIGAGTTLSGSTQIGTGSVIGPNTRIVDSKVGERTTVLMSNIESSTVGNDVWIGPFAHLRPKTVLADGVKVGNFVELKNAQLGEGAKANHLSYVGDATVGSNANIGAGTITCNYDGFHKHETKIGKDAFVGSNSTLVAPVQIGDGAIVAAGSVVTHPVPADAMAFGRARQETKEGKAKKWREIKRSTK